MSLIDRIDKFIFDFKKYLFSYKDGFFVLPYLANSPEAMVEGFERMPFVTKYKEANYITTENPFYDGDCHYEKLEEGLWVMVSNTNFKRNVSFNMVFDKTLPSEYYMLSLYSRKSSSEVKSVLIEESTSTDRFWTLYKPGKKTVNGHFANTACIFFVIYFTKEWFENNARKDGLFKGGILDEFINSNKDFLFFNELYDGAGKASQPILDTILNKGDKGVQDILKLKIQTLSLFSSFLEGMVDKELEAPANPIKDSTRRKLIKVEKILSDSVFQEFPGLDNLAKEAGFSVTKLKTDFKVVFGVTVFKYFQQKQMETARNIILEKPETQVKELAQVFHYANSSKFSAAFKKHFGYSPSEVIDAHAF